MLQDSLGPQQLSTLQSAPVPGFGTGKRPGMAERLRAPGPGAYKARPALGAPCNHTPFGLGLGLCSGKTLAAQHGGAPARARSPGLQGPPGPGCALESHNTGWLQTTLTIPGARACKPGLTCALSIASHGLHGRHELLSTMQYPACELQKLSLLVLHT